jgi:GGDEF domain-containing protein
LALLGYGVDVLDEFWMLPKAWWWDNVLESGLTLLGLASLTWGLHGWRKEQLVFNEQLRRRERALRDHRRIDPISSLADSRYMAAQLSDPRPGGALLMLRLDDLDRVVREAGIAESDRLLAGAAQLLCLNLGPDELVCRYAGAHFVVWLPRLQAAQAQAVAEQLAAALSSWSHVDAQGRRWRLLARAAAQDLAEPRDPHERMAELAQGLARAT